MIANSLAAINSSVTSHDLIQHTIMGLGTKYYSLYTTITHFTGNITFDNLRAKLLIQEQRINHIHQQDLTSTTHQEFATSFSGSPNGGSHPSRSNRRFNTRGGRSWRGHCGHGGRGRSRGQYAILTVISDLRKLFS